MLVKIALIVALCSGTSFDQVQKRIHEIQSQNPDAIVSVRIDKKAACSKDGQILTGKEAKLFEALGK